tara:strand:+ start:9337 stop:9984 length:648 start_codon:yes stop_codon:yes gene_type:complete
MRSFLVFLALFPFILFAQERVVFENEFKQSFHTKPKLDVKLDNRFSFISDNDVKTIGLKIGLKFNRKFKVGIGLNQMLLPVEKHILSEDNVLLPVDLEYSYFSPYVEYVYFNSKRWEFSLSTQLGFGSASYRHIDANGKKFKLIESTVLSYEPAMLIDYKIIRWFGIGTGVGYRLVYYKSKGMDQEFSSPEYVVKLKIYLGEIVRTITGKQLEID